MVVLPCLPCKTKLQKARRSPAHTSSAHVKPSAQAPVASARAPCCECWVSCGRASRPPERRGADVTKSQEILWKKTTSWMMLQKETTRQWFSLSPCPASKLGPGLERVTCVACMEVGPFHQPRSSGSLKVVLGLQWTCCGFSHKSQARGDILGSGSCNILATAWHFTCSVPFNSPSLPVYPFPGACSLFVQKHCFSVAHFRTEGNKSCTTATSPNTHEWVLHMLLFFGVCVYVTTGSQPPHPPKTKNPPELPPMSESSG